MTKPLAKLSLWVLVLVGIPAGLYLGRTFLVPLAIAAVLSMMLSPAMDWLMSKNFSKGLAIAASTFLLVLFFAGLVLLLYYQVGAVADDWPKIQNKASRMLEQTQSYIEQKVGVSPRRQIEQAKGILSSISSVGRAMLGSFTSAVTSFLLVLVYVVVMLMERERFKKFILKIVPDQNKGRAGEAIQDVRETVGGYFWGRLKIMGILAAVYAAGFLIGGVGYAWLLSLIVAIFSLIPYLGNIIGGGLAVLLALVSTGVSGVLVVVGVMVVAQIIENYVLTPWIVGQELDLNPFITIATVIAFTTMWGAVGAIVALPITGMLREIFEFIPSTQSLAYLLSGGKDKSKE